MKIHKFLVFLEDTEKNKFFSMMEMLANYSVNYTKRICTTYEVEVDAYKDHFKWYQVRFKDINMTLEEFVIKYINGLIESYVKSDPENKNIKTDILTVNR